jgi:WD40 repeat protein
MDLKGHTESVNEIEFSPDGQTIASASADGTVRIWYLDIDSLVAYGCRQLWDDFLDSSTVTDDDISFCREMIARHPNEPWH